VEVSVVVPTRDRADAVARCLRALAADGKPPDEVVIVDDNGRDTAALRGIVSRHPGARLVHADGRGPAAARNAGAAEAGGEIVCFTDDDCEPAPGWARLLAARAREGTGAAAGRTMLAANASAYDAATQTIVDRLQLDSLDPATGALGFAPTCNLACSRDLLRELPFDASFPDAAGEDREWCARIGAAGSPPGYEPRAVVRHRPRLTAGSFLRQHFRYGRGGARFRAATRAAGTLGSPPPASFYRHLAAGAARRGPAVAGLVGVAQLATAAGVAAERIAPG